MAILQHSPPPPKLWTEILAPLRKVQIDGIQYQVVQTNTKQAKLMATEEDLDEAFDRLRVSNEFTIEGEEFRLKKAQLIIVVEPLHEPDETKPLKLE